MFRSGGEVEMSCQSGESAVGTWIVIKHRRRFLGYRIHDGREVKPTTFTSSNQNLNLKIILNSSPKSFKYFNKS